MSNNEHKNWNEDGDEQRGWRFEAPAREQLLERRIRDLEGAVSRLEKELRLMKLDDTPLDNLNTIRNVTKNLNIGALGGVIGNSVIGNRAELYPIEPYKAD